MAIFAVFCFTGILTTLWFLGGAFNQNPASISLLIVSCWLASAGKNYRLTLYPEIFLFITTICAAIWISYGTIKHFFVTPKIPIDRVIGDWLTFLIAVFTVIFATILLKDSLAAISKFTQERKAAAPAPAPAGSSK